MKTRVLIASLLVLIFAQFSALAQTGTPLRRPISPRQPMWLIHIDTWNYADPQKIIALIPPDVRPFVVMNISLSISHNETTSRFQVAEYGYEIAKSWLRACAENRMWAMVQPSSGGFSQFSDFDMSVYEEFYRDYPNFIGFNYCEQFWGYDSPTDPLSANWTDRIAHFANLLGLSNRYGGYLVVSWCGNQWSPNINPIAMVKRIPAFAAACRNYTENYILCEKYTQQSYQSDMESVCLGAYLSGYSGQYGIRYDDTGWTDTTGAHANFTMATAGAPVLEHGMLTGQTVIDGPELIWTQCFRELGATGTTDGYTMRRWGTFPQFDNVSVDHFRKILDGTVRIPSRREVIDRTKVVIVNNVNSGGNDTIYSSPDTMFEGLYRMDGDGNLLNNKTFFKKTGRYPTVPTVYQLDDADANSFQVKVNRSAFATRWPSVASKTTEFNTLFPEEYTGDLYAGRHENGWVIYNPFKTVQTASGSIPFKYNTCDRMELTFSQYTAGVVKEISNKVTFYLSNYQNEIDTTVKTDTIRIFGSTSEPTWSYADRGSHQASVVTKNWSGGVLTLTIQHNGALDITVNCSGAATSRLTSDTAAANVIVPERPAAFAGPRQYEAECFDYKSISGIVAGGQNGGIRTYSGQGYLQLGTNSAAAVRDTVSVLNSGTYRLETRYSVEGGNVDSVDLYVNGARVTTPVFAQTATFSAWAVHKQNVTLAAGQNTIEFRATATGARTLYFDKIVVVPTTVENGLVIQENGAGFGGVDGTIDSNQAGYTGAGFANTTDSMGAGINWWLDFPAAETGVFTFRYASLEDRVADLYVNGVKLVSNIDFSATGSLASWDLVTVHANVDSGLCNLKLAGVSPAGLPNIDFLGVGGETAAGTSGPVVDVYVRDGGNAGTNFGAASQLVCKYDAAINSGYTRVTYLKFDVSDLAEAQSVKLKLVPFQVDGTASLAFERIADDSWSEVAMTWNNRPTGTGTLVASVGGFVVGQQIEVDLTNVAKSEAAGDGILSLRVSNDGWNFIGFHSKESTTADFRPVLESTVTVPTVRPGAVKKAYLRFDDANGTTAVDSTGNGWNGTLVNGPTWESGSNARVNRALGFDGGNHVTLPTGIVSDFTDFTVSFWLKPDTISDGARVFDFSTGTTNNSLYFTPRTLGGMMRFAIHANGTEQTLEAPSAAHFQTGTWTHVTVTLSGDSAKLYINGTETAANESMTHRLSNLGVTTSNFIGKSASPFDPAFDGKVDEFRIYNGAMNAGDVALLATPPAAPANFAAAASSSKVFLSWSAVPGAISYTIRRAAESGGPYTDAGSATSTSFTDTTVINGATYYYLVTASNGIAEGSFSTGISALPSPLSAHLRFDDGSGTMAADSTGNGWTGTLVNNPAWVSASKARLGGALSLNGSNHVTLPAGIVSGLNDCTVAFWVRLNTISNWSRVFDFNNGTTTSSMYFVPRTAGGLIRFGLNGQNLETTSAVQFSVDAWTHVAITLSGNTGTIYLNGAPVATSATMTNNPSGLGNTPNNYIGKSASTADANLNGTVDEFLIYGVPLGAAEITALAALPAGPPNPTATAGNTQVALGWTPVAGANTYNVRRSTTSGGPYTSLATVSGSGHTDTSVTNGITYFYVITIASGAGQGSTSGQVGAIPLQTFAQWVATAFPGEDSLLVIGATADPDADGLPNLVEYYFGTLPQAGDSFGATRTDFSPADHVVFIYRMAKNVTGVTASVRTSTGLVAWTDAGVTPTIVNDQGSHYVMRALVPRGSSPALFLHLAIRKP